MQNLFICFLLLYVSSSSTAFNQNTQFNQNENYEGASDLINLQYHMGPVLSSPISLYIIWYGQWKPTQQATVRDFVHSISSSATYPSVADWWRTVRLYSDQSGANITGNVVLTGEFYDYKYSHGAHLTRLDMQSIIKTAVTGSRALPLNPYNGLYLILTSYDVQVQEFCRAVCGFHYFTFPHIVGATVPYAWIGYSGSQCPGMCAYPFAWPKDSPGKQPPGIDVMRSPNGDPGVDGMISVIAHELAEVTSNPLVNAWYAGDDPSAPTEIADLCMGVYGTGGGSGYVGRVYKDSWGSGFNVNGVKGRRFLIQWIWNPLKRRCYGPNSLD